MLQPGRTYTLGGASGYRYGFNGKENDKVKGTGNQQDYGLRIYDPRVARFLSMDMLYKDYPELTPYQFASNTPIRAVDLDGGEMKDVIQAGWGLPSRERSQDIRNRLAKRDGKEWLLAPAAVVSVGAGTVLATSTSAVTTLGGWLLRAGGWTSQPQNQILLAEGATFVGGLLNPGPEDINPNSNTDELGKALKVLGNKILFRGDTREAAKIFKEGFNAKRTNTDLMRYVEENVPSVFVSTSKSMDEAARKATGEYVYFIDHSTGDGFDVNNFYKALGEVNIFAKEQEVVFKGQLNSQRIMGAVKIGEKGEVGKTFLLNPNYKPAK